MNTEFNAENMKKTVDLMDQTARKLSELGFDNKTISEMFFAYGIRIGALVAGYPVFGAARMVIDKMEAQSRG